MAPKNSRQQFISVHYIGAHRALPSNLKYYLPHEGRTIHLKIINLAKETRNCGEFAMLLHGASQQLPSIG